MLEVSASRWRFALSLNDRVREAAVRTLGQLFYKDDTTDFSFFDARNTIWVVEALYAIYPDSPEFVKLAIMITMGELVYHPRHAQYSYIYSKTCPFHRGRVRPHI